MLSNYSETSHSEHPWCVNSFLSPGKKCKINYRTGQRLSLWFSKKIEHLSLFQIYLTSHEDAEDRLADISVHALLARQIQDFDSCIVNNWCRQLSPCQSNKANCLRVNQMKPICQVKIKKRSFILRYSYPDYVDNSYHRCQHYRFRA